MTMASSTANTTKPIYLVAIEGGGTSFRVAIGQLFDNNTGTSEKTTPTSDNDAIPDILQHIIVDDTNKYIKVIDMKQFDSSNNPHQCIEECCLYIKEFQKQILLSNGIPNTSINNDNDNSIYNGIISSLGIASFGPIGLHHHNNNEYGTILSSTPKAIWRNVNVIKPFQVVCQLTDHSIMFDTDVNAPAYSEYIDHNRMNTSNNHISSCAYITIGTGVGVGLIINDLPVHGYMHPEGGHVCIQPLNDNDIDSFHGYSWGKGNCPYDGIDTVEGTTSSIALIERYYHRQQKEQQESEGGDTITETDNDNTSTILDRDILKEFSDHDIIWDYCINAISNLCVTLLLLNSIEKIILGGGIISSRKHILLFKIHERTQLLLNNYIPNIPLSNIITISSYHEYSGLVGAIHLSYRAYCNTQQQQKQQSTTATITQPTSNNAKEEQEQEQEQKDGVITRMKQDAFHIGLIHGIVVGMIITGLVIKYIWPTTTRNNSSSYQRHHR